MKPFLLFAAALAVSNVAAAQTVREGSLPLSGVEVVASVGSNVFERFRYAAIPAYEIAGPVRAKIMLANVDIPAGAKLLRIDSRTKLKACYVLSLEDYAIARYFGCLMDDDGDGKFDRVAGNEIQGGKKLPAPVAYTPTELIMPAPNNLKQVVIYLGSTSDTLRLSYREFLNDMARPAFTEEYSFPLTPTFPQTIAFKDVKLIVNKVDGEGIHYKVN